MRNISVGSEILDSTDTIPQLDDAAGVEASGDESEGANKKHWTKRSKGKKKLG